MSNIIRISLNKNMKDIYLLFWSVFLPLACLYGLFYFDVNVSINTLLGILSMSIFFYCCTTNSFSTFAQRKRGVFDLLTITPFSLWKYLASITISQTVIACIFSILLLLVENSLFELKLSIVNIVFCIPLFLVGSAILTLLGFSLSSFPKNEGQLSITTNVILIPLILCSSIFLNMEEAPKFVQWVSWVNPLEWLQKGYQAALEMNYTGWIVSVLVLVGFFGAFLSIAIATFRIKEN